MVPRNSCIIPPYRARLRKGQGDAATAAPATTACSAFCFAPPTLYSMFHDCSGTVSLTRHHIRKYSYNGDVSLPGAPTAVAARSTSSQSFYSSMYSYPYDASAINTAGIIRCCVWSCCAPPYGSPLPRRVAAAAVLPLYYYCCCRASYPWCDEHPSTSEPLWPEI